LSHFACIVRAFGPYLAATDIFLVYASSSSDGSGSSRSSEGAAPCGVELGAIGIDAPPPDVGGADLSFLAVSDSSCSAGTGLCDCGLMPMGHGEAGPNRGDGASTPLDDGGIGGRAGGRGFSLWERGTDGRFRWPRPPPAGLARRPGTASAMRQWQRPCTASTALV
jgi:hypothetical protein